MSQLLQQSMTTIEGAHKSPQQPKNLQSDCLLNCSERGQASHVSSKESRTTIMVFTTDGREYRLLLLVQSNRVDVLRINAWENGKDEVMSILSFYNHTNKYDRPSILAITGAYVLPKLSSSVGIVTQLVLAASARAAAWGAGAPTPPSPKGGWGPWS